MKNKVNKITLIYICIAILVAFSSLKFLHFITNDENFILTHSIRDLVLIIFSAVVLRYFLNNNFNLNYRRYLGLELSNNEIREAKERYDIVAKATSDTIWDWNITTREFEWSKGIEEVFGYAREDVGTDAQWWFDRIHPQDSIKMSVKLYSFLEQKTQKWQDEYRFKCKDGSYKFVLDRGFLVMDEQGTPVRMIGAMQDITQRKEEERRLKLLETVITNTNDGVVITDSDASEVRIPKILFVNEAFTRMTGYEYTEAVGKSPLDFFGEKSNKTEIDRLAGCVARKIACEIETIAYKKNGDTFWLRVSMIPNFNSEGEHTHWISMQRDITERKRQEKEKEQLITELTQNNKDLRQFSYITSHNLRAPLSNLTGLLRILEDIPIENAELSMILDGFRKSTHHLNETVADLGRVVIIRDNPSIEKQDIVIRESWANVTNQIDRIIENAHAILNFEVEGSGVLHINKAYFESILLNLLTNAIKYRSPERPPKIDIHFSEDEEAVRLVFRDNGIGIDVEKYKEKIFGLYQRFHNYPDSKGLGLYLVKSQIESMGGSIEIESELDKGTQFTIQFTKSY